MANEIGLTEVSATSADLVASIIQETLKQRSILLPTVSDYSRFAVSGSKTVAVPRRDQFAAGNKVENTDLVAQELTFSTDIISLNKNKAIYAKLERIAELQATVAVNAEIVKEMAAELALQIDKDLIVELQAASAAAPDHRVAWANAPTSTIQATDILEARRLLNLQNVAQENRWMLIPPDQEKAMLQIANFIEVEKYGPNQAIASAELGRIYGFRVLMHNSVAVDESIFYHGGAVGYASQMRPEFRTDMELKSASKEYLMQVIYGLTVLDSGKRQVLFNNDGL